MVIWILFLWFTYIIVYFNYFIDAIVAQLKIYWWNNSNYLNISRIMHSKCSFQDLVTHLISTNSNTLLNLEICHLNMYCDVSWMEEFKALKTLWLVNVCDRLVVNILAKCANCLEKLCILGRNLTLLAIQLNNY